MFAKLLQELKSTPVSYKKSTGFSCMAVMPNLLFFGTLLRENLCMGSLIYIIDFLTHAHLRLGTESLCLCLTSETASLSSGFFVHHRFTLIACVTTSG